MILKKLGFTMVEVLVVITILSIMAGVLTLAFIAGQNQSRAAQAESIAKIVASAAEKYYLKNNEYPSSSAIAGASGELTETEFKNAATVLGVQPSTLRGQNDRDFQLLPCNQASSPNCPLNTVQATQSYVHYVTRANNGGNGTINSSLYNSNCTVTIPSATGSTAFFVAYYSPSADKWVLLRSKTGSVTVSGSCSFS